MSDVAAIVEADQRAFRIENLTTIKNFMSVIDDIKDMKSQGFKSSEAVMINTANWQVREFQPPDWVNLKPVTFEEFVKAVWDAEELVING